MRIIREWAGAAVVVVPNEVAFVDPALPYEAAVAQLWAALPGQDIAEVRASLRPVYPWQDFLAAMERVLNSVPRFWRMTIASVAATLVAFLAVMVPAETAFASDPFGEPAYQQLKAAGSWQCSTAEGGAAESCQTKYGEAVLVESVVRGNRTDLRFRYVSAFTGARQENLLLLYPTAYVAAHDDKAGRRVVFDRWALSGDEPKRLAIWAERMGRHGSKAEEFAS